MTDVHQKHEQTQKLHPDYAAWGQAVDPVGGAHREIKLNPDGSFTRCKDPVVSPTGDRLPEGSSDPALSKDIPLNKSHGTFIRIFRRRPLLHPQRPNERIPILIYIHGGCFIFLSAANPIFHKLCAQMAAELPALVLSVEYRKAPEHRLPAAYDDVVDALIWIREQARQTTETWLDQADFSNCFIMGNSSGGNIAFHAAIRALELDLNPVKLSGLILDQPGFNGEERTESELRMAKDEVLPMTKTDSMYELALPEGANRDHEYSNPMKMKGKVKGLPRCLITGYLGDRLIDRQRMVADMLEEEGVTVVRRMDQEGYHGINLVNSDKTAALLYDVKNFVYEFWM